MPDGRPTITVHGAQELDDWGSRDITVYRDNIGEMAFSATYDLEQLEGILAANMNQGLFVIAAFLRFKPGEDHSNFLCREFYYHESNHV